VKRFNSPARLRLNRGELRDRILGCWTGKNIGGTLGGPHEGSREVLDIQGYSTPPGEPLPNDDLDLQLVWLKALQDRGPLGVDAAVLGEYWLEAIGAHWNEYGVNKANQRLGLVPPLSGAFENHWKHSNGAWIRSEIWACLAPGAPDLAVRYAYEDACVDHGDGEGVPAELFTAALQSAAFVCSDRDQLLEAGLARIPAESRVARSVRLAIDAHAAGSTWQEAREAIVADSADLGWFQAPANVAFAVVGWLWGEGDFGRSITIAANCGDDTDCSAATLGALLGIIEGRQALPAEWTEPIGDRILTVAIDRAAIKTVPETVQELTDAVLALAPGFLAAHGAPVDIVDESPTDLSSLDGLLANPGAVVKEVWARTAYTRTFDFVHTAVTIDYGRDPVVRPGEAFAMRVSFGTRFHDRRDLELEWLLPDGWEVRPGRRTQLRVQSPTTSEHAVDVHLGQPPAVWPPTTDAVFEIVPASGAHGTCRGVLQVLAQGRPTVGLVPLVFLVSGQ
jgi:ADP-ribosylglycohydrolase